MAEKTPDFPGGQSCRAAPPSGGANRVTLTSMESEEPFPKIDRSLHRFRRNLPYWQSGGSTLLANWTCLPGITMTAQERSIVMDCIRKFDGDRYTVFAAVVMPDHVHVLLHPLEQSPGVWWSLGRILQGMKGVSARMINKNRRTTGSIWLDERYDRIIRSPSDFEEKWRYIRLNPSRAGLVDRPEDWDTLYIACGPDGWMPKS